MRHVEPSGAAYLSGRRLFQTLLESSPGRFEVIHLLSGLSDFDLKLSALGLHKLVKRAGRKELDDLSRTSVHQGVVFAVRPLPEVSLDKMLAAAKGSDEHQVVLVLDEVVDPQNFGSLMRVAEVAGCTGLVITERRSAPLSPAARRASAGASEILPLARVTNLRRALDELKDAGFWTVGTSLEDRSQNLYSFKFPPKTALVLGSEGSGLRALTADECDFLVKIPMWGKVESLNVSQAGSVCLFEYRRQVSVS